MAQQIQTLYIDDIDGGEAAGTVRFGLDGAEYEIDLSTKHTDELHTALAKYIGHARKVGGASKRAPRGRRAASTIDTTAVRIWAREQGYGIKDRGRDLPIWLRNTRRQREPKDCVRLPPRYAPLFHQAAQLMEAFS